MTTVGKSAIRADARPVQRLIYFHGAPPTFNDATEKLALGGNLHNPNPRYIVFIKDEYREEWLNLFATDSFNEITDEDRARNDYPTKSEDVKIPESFILGTSIYMGYFGNKLAPYYVCRFVEPKLPLTIILK